MATAKLKAEEADVKGNEAEKYEQSARFRVGEIKSFGSKTGQYTRDPIHGYGLNQIIIKRFHFAFSLPIKTNQIIKCQFNTHRTKGGG